MKINSQDHWSPVGVVSGYGSTPRSYVVETSDGKMVRRNRRHLQVIPDAVPEINSVPETGS